MSKTLMASPTDTLVHVKVKEIHFMVYYKQFNACNVSKILVKCEIKNNTQAPIYIDLPEKTNKCLNEVRKNNLWISKDSILTNLIGLDRELGMSIWANGTREITYLIIPPSGSKSLSDLNEKFIFLANGNYNLNYDHLIYTHADKSYLNPSNIIWNKKKPVVKFYLDYTPVKEEDQNLMNIKGW